MAIPIYAVCKAKAKTIVGIGCEIPKKEGRLKLEGDAQCRYEKLGGVFHYYFKIQAETLYMNEEKFNFNNSNIEIQVNVRSHEGRKTPKLEYLFKEDVRDKDEKKFSLKELSKLDYGIKIFNYEQEENKENPIALDYIRSNLFDMEEFKSVPTTSDLNQELHEHIIEAKNKNADIYIFGDLYSFETKEGETREERFISLKKTGPRGIHDVHMNQGSFHKKEWIFHNGEYQDGGMFIHFNSKEEDRWVGIFLMFEGQYKRYIEKN